MGYDLSLSWKLSKSFQITRLFGYYIFRLYAINPLPPKTSKKIVSFEIVSVSKQAFKGFNILVLLPIKGRGGLLKFGICCVSNRLSCIFSSFCGRIKYIKVLLLVVKPTCNSRQITEKLKVK